MAIRNSRITAVAIGTAVLVGASSFGAVAAKLVTSDDIKNQTIQKVDIGKDAVGGSEVKDGSLKVKDFTSDALDSLKGATGPAGAKGDKGEPGVNGADGVSGYEVFTSVQDFGPGGIGGAWCGAPEANTQDEGWRVVGGGAMLTPADVNAGVAVVSSWPNLDEAHGGINPGWNVQLNKPTNVDPGEVTLYAVCVKVSG